MSDPLPSPSPTAAGLAEVKPGDWIDLACPEGTTFAAPEGATFPPQNPVVVVVRVEGNKIRLGPLRGGEVQGELDCSDGSKVKLAYKMQPPKPEEAPKKAPALGLSSLAFPWLLWLLLLLLAFLIAGIVYGVRRWIKNRQRPVKKSLKAPPPPPPPPADEAMRTYLRTAEKGGWASTDNPKDARALYVEGYDRLRSYLEFRLGFAAGSETTREYLGTLKSRLMVARPADSGTIGVKVETLLGQAEQVRFAGTQPPAPDRKAFLAGLREIYLNFGGPPT